MGVVLAYQNSNEIILNFRLLDYKYFIFAIIMAGLASFMSAYKLFKTFSYALSFDINFSEWLHVYIKSYFLNFFVPMLGMLFRGNYLKKKYNISYTDYIAASYLFAVVGLLVLLMLCSLLLAMFEEKYFFLIPSISIIFLVYVKIIFFKKISEYSFEKKTLNYYFKKLSIFSELLNLVYYKNKFFNYLIIFVITACIDLLVFVITLNGFAHSISLESLILIYLAYTVSWFIRITPGNIGIQEAIISTASSMTGFGALSGTILSLLLRLINLGGILLLWCVLKVIYMLKRHEIL